MGQKEKQRQRNRHKNNTNLRGIIGCTMTIQHTSLATDHDRRLMGTGMIRKGRMRPSRCGCLPCLINMGTSLSQIQANWRIVERVGVVEEQEGDKTITPARGPSMDRRRYRIREVIFFLAPSHCIINQELEEIEK